MEYTETGDTVMRERIKMLRGSFPSCNVWRAMMGRKVDATKVFPPSRKYWMNESKPNLRRKMRSDVHDKYNTKLTWCVRLCRVKPCYLYLRRIAQNVGRETSGNDEGRAYRKRNTKELQKLHLCP